MEFKYLKNNKLPDKPGVYFFLKNKKIIYVGKATSLKDRVKSYFGKDLINTRGPLLVDMVFNADQIKFEVTDSVLEALILEANLIKKHQPKYNTKEKSDKSFNYVCITKGDMPELVVIRGKNIKNNSFSKIYGPYTSGSSLREALKIIRKIFPFIDRNSKIKMNYEFYRQLGLTPDVSTKDLKNIYKKNILNLKLFFEGKKKKVIFNLKKEMFLYAKNKEFEKAGEIKKQIFALHHINDVALLKQENKTGDKNFSPAPFFGRIKGSKVGPSDIKFLSPILSSRISRIEAYDIAHMGGKNMVGVMTVVVDGEIEKSEYKKFKIKTQTNTNDTGALKEILERRLAHSEWTYPDLIVVDGGVAQLNTAKNVLAKLSIPRVSLGIQVVSVLKDDRHKAKDILGDKNLARKYEKEILLANSEAHRFAINYHKQMRNKNFLI
jgi:excinuclease ABC subunit C